MPDLLPSRGSQVLSLPGALFYPEKLPVPHSVSWDPLSLWPRPTVEWAQPWGGPEVGQAHSFISGEADSHPPPHSPKGIYCHLSESFLVFLVFPLTFCHIHTLLKPYGKGASCRERAWEQTLSCTVPCFFLGSEAHLAQPGAQCPPERGSRQPQFLSDLKSKKIGEGKEGTWRLKLLTPCFLGVMSLRGPC